MAWSDEIIKAGRKKKKEESFSEQVINGSYTYNAKVKNTPEPQEIAPVKEDKSWWEQIIQAPDAFDDGYQFGDITKTILGTTADLGLGAVKGVAQTGEGIGKFLAGGVAQVSDWIGQDEYADKVRKNLATKAPPVSSWIGKQQDKVDDFSVLGNTGDKVSEAIGYIGSIWAGGAVGGAAGGAIGGTTKAASLGANIGQTGLMFGSSAGSNLSEAYGKEGVEDWQAWTKALGGATIETTTERLFGVFGTSGLDKGIANAVSRKITSGAGKLLARAGVQATGEATEELLAYMGNQGLDLAIDKVSNGKGAEFKEDWNWEEVGEQMAVAFLASGALGGGASVAQIVDNKANSNTWGKATNETAKQQDMQGIQEDIEGLNNKLNKEGKHSLKGDEIQAQINKKQAQLNDIAPVDNTAQIQGLQEAIATKQQELSQSQDVREQQIIQEEIEILNQELIEATNAQQITSEEDLKKQRFTYEVAENDSEYKQAVYESASKYMNDTKETHDFVDTVAKIAEERGTKYEFVNTEAIKEAGYNIENASVNGLVTEDGRILVNVDSNQGLDFILGHETTHLLEGTQEYQALQDLVLEYAKSKGIYEDRAAKLHSLYKDTNANIDAELTSDLVGELLFTDAKFVENLSVKQPTLFEKIKNFISDLIVKFKGTAQEKQLREIQRSFEKAYRAKGTQTTTQTTTETTTETNTEAQLSVSESTTDNHGRELSKEQQDFFKDSKVRDENGNLLAVYHGTRSDFNTFNTERTGQNYEGDYSSLGKGSYFTADIDVAKDFGESSINEGDLNIKETYLNIKNPFYADDIAKNDSRVLEEIKEKYDIKESEMYNGYNLIRLLRISGVDSTEVLQGYGYDGIIGDNEYVAFESNQIKNVDNTKPTLNPDIRYSLSTTDNQRRKLSKEQQEYFKDSKVRDENGNLEVMYHATDSDFNVFDKKYIGTNAGASFGNGFYFSSVPISEYGEAKQVYLNVKKPYIINDINNKEEISNFLKLVGADVETIEAFYKYSDGDGKYTISKVLKETYNQELTMLKEKGFDGIVIKNSIAGINKKVNIGTEVVVFDSNQIKNVDNTNPTSNPDIRYSLSEEGKMIDTSTNKEVKLEAAEAGTHGTLMAIHNLTDYKLKGILELGGFPVPSIAITKPTLDFTNYGEISVIFDKETINPTNKLNAVYGSDVYSPRFPDTVNKLNQSGVKQVAEVLGMSPYQFEINYENLTIEDVISRISRDENLIDRYLESKNITVDPIIKQYSAEQSKVKAKFVEDFLNTHTELKNNDINLREIDYDLYSDEVKQIYIDNLLSYGATIEDAQDIYKDFAKADVTKFLIDVKNFKKLNPTEQTIDEYATKKAKESHIDFNSEEYRSFVENIISPAFDEKYIRNNKDLFTPSGNRRSFNQLYDAYNLDNVVKQMKGKVRGEEGFFYGAGNIRSQITPQFKSIAEIKDSEGKLITYSQMEEVKNDINSDLNNLSVTARNFGGNSYDSYEYALNEIAGLKKITTDKVRGILSDYGFKDVPDILVNKSIEFLEKLKNAPTEYFEAKPQRAVGFDEVQAIVVPYNMSADLKQQLYDNGLNVIEYDPNIEGDRQAKINELDELKFSLTAQDEAPIGNVFGKDLKYQVEEAIAPLQETIEVLTEQVQKLQEDLDLAPTSQDIVEQQGQEAANSITDNDAPKSFEDMVDEVLWNETFETGETTGNNVPSPFDNRDIDAVGKRNVKAYQYENPEVRPYFRAEAENMMYDLNNTIKGERSFNDQLYYDSNGEQGFYGTTRQTTEAIAYLKDNYGYSYAQIEKGLNDIIEDNGKENNAVAKRIEFMLDERLREGYTTSDGIPIPPNEEYINFLRDKQITEYNKEAFNALTDEDAPEAPETTTEPQTLQVEESIAPIENEAQNRNTELSDTSTETQEQEKATKEYEKHTGFKVEKQDGGEKLTKILTDMPKEVQKSRVGEYAETAAIKIIDKGFVVKNEALRFKNQTLEEDYNQIKHANREAINMAMDGYKEWNIDLSKKRRKGRLQSKKVAKSIEEALEPIKKTNSTPKFYDYMYNQLNIDRMSIESNAQAKIDQMLESDTILKELNKRTTLSQIEKKIVDGITQTNIDEIIDQELFNKNNDLFSSKQLRKEEAQRLRDSVWEIVKLKKAKNKVLLGTTAEQSVEHLKQYEGETKFKTAQKDIYTYREKLQDILVDSGMLSEEQKAYMNEMYPHYIPAYRNVGKQVINVNSFNNNIKPNDAIGKAKGGTQDILPLDHSLMVKTKQVVQSARVNKYLQNLKNTYEKNGILNIISSENSTAENTFEEGTSTERLSKTDKGQYTATVYENGKKTVFEISKGQYDALKPSDIPVITTLNTFVDMKRALLTQYNLYFAFRNLFRDMPTAWLQSQDGLKWITNIPEAAVQVAKKGQYYQYAQSLGAGNNDYADMNKIGYADISPIDINAEHKGNKFSRGWEAFKNWKGVKWIATINEFIEQVPRMAEFITAVDSGKSGAGAIYAQDEVTVNFGKGGDVTKTLDRNVTNFVNANIQGGYKIANVFRDAYAYNGSKGLAKVITKYAIAGGSLAALMGAIWDDDEDYEELSDYIKQNYYVIGKYGDGQFIKIPKGRTNAVVESLFNEGASVLKGEKDVGEATSSFMKVVENNLAPNSLVESSIFAGIYQTLTNTSWYGEDIVPSRLQKEEAKDQYDETTDAFSIWLGQTFGISPYKAHYLLDQSTGFLGDMILPLMTEQAETPIDNPIGETFLGQLYKDYTADSTMKNQDVTDIFALTDEGSNLYVASHKTGAKDEDILKYKYLTSVTGSMNDLYAEKRTIQNETGLTNSEKIDALRDVQRQIDDLAKEGLENYENITKTSNYAAIGDKEYYLKNDTWTKVESDELEELNSLDMDIKDKSTYFTLKGKISSIKDSDTENKKAEIATAVKNTNLSDEQKAYVYGKNYSSDETLDLVVKSGIPFNTYLDYASQEFVADKNSDGKSISGSRKKKVISYINSLSLNIPQKAMLIRKEYSSFDDYNNDIVNYVSGLDLEYQDKVEMLKTLDMTVDANGYVHWE